MVGPGAGVAELQDHAITRRLATTIGLLLPSWSDRMAKEQVRIEKPGTPSRNLAATYLAFVFSFKASNACSST